MKKLNGNSSKPVLSEVLLQKIRERLDELIIEKWWDYGHYEEIRDKDYVAKNILEDILEHYC